MSDPPRLINPAELAAVENAIETAQAGDFFELTDEEAHMCRAIFLSPNLAGDENITADELSDVELFATVLKRDY